MKFRTCNHRLKIETGRYVNVPRVERFCDLCSSSELGDEFHLFFKCCNDNVIKARRKHIRVLCERPSMYKLIKSLKILHDPCIGFPIAKFIRDCIIT